MKAVFTPCIANGVEGMYINETRFKTSRISINMYVPNKRENCEANALLSGLMMRASKDYPGFTELNRRLSELYGATLFADVAKYGDMQLVKFVIGVLDDSYTLENENVSAAATDLLLSMIFEPVLENGVFRSEDFESEKRILRENIEGEINDKRRYAINTAEKMLFENEPSGNPRYGTVEALNSLTAEDTVKAWRQLIKTAYVRVNVISKSAPDSVYNKVAQYFSTLNRNVEKTNYTLVHTFGGEVKQLEEKMDVTQCKMCLAFCYDADGSEDEKIAARVMTDMFGGGPYSKLFRNVREKESLCYYCAAIPNHLKGTVMVDSGILEENRVKAYDGILHELEAMKKGDFTDEDVTASKISLCDSARTISDSPVDIDTWYSMRCYNTAYSDPDEFIGAIMAVTKERIVAVANKMKLEAVYFLASEGEAE